MIWSEKEYFELLFLAFAKSRITPMYDKASLSANDLRAAALSIRQVTFRRSFIGLMAENWRRKALSRTGRDSLVTNVAHMYDVAVSRSVRIFCLWHLITSVAKCSPKVAGGGTDDCRGSMCFLLRFAAHFSQD